MLTGDKSHKLEIVGGQQLREWLILLG